MDPPRDPNQRAHGQVWSDGTFLHQTRARTQGAQASPSRQAEPQQGTNRARRAGRSHKRKHRDLSPDSRQEESPNTNDARFPPPQSSSHGILGARIRRPSIASQDAFFARHFDYDDPNSRNAEEPAWKEQLDEFNLDLEDDQTQSIITDAQMLPKIPVAQMLPIFYQANTNDTVDAELHQSFDSLFDSPPAKKTRYNTPHHINPKKVEDLLLDSALNWKKGPILNPRTSTRSRYQAVGSIDDDQNDDARKKSRHVPGFSQDESSDDGMASVLPESKPASPKVNHSKTYKRTAEQTSNITISKWVEETTQLLLAQRTRLHFALNNAASSLGRQFSVEEVRSMQSAWHNVERAVTGLEIEAVRQEMM